MRIALSPSQLNLLTNSQCSVAREIYAFVNDDKTKCHILEGYAGTGKTHTIATIVDSIYEKMDVAIAAVSHTAVKVLGKKILTNDKLKNIKSFTIAKFMGQLQDFSNPKYSPDKPLYRTSEYAPFRKFTGLLIVDECSMLDYKSLRKLLTETKCKILFLGDFKQLPPIESETSDNASAIYAKMPKSVLSEIIRTKKEDIANLSMMLRTSDYTKIFKLNDSDNIKVVNYSNYDNSADVILAFRNKTIQKWNSSSYMHHYNDSNISIREGLKIILYKNMYCGYNAEVISITNISPNPIIPGLTCRVFDIKSLEDNNEPLRLSKIEDETLNKGLDSHVVKLSNNLKTLILTDKGYKDLIKLAKYYFKTKAWAKLDKLSTSFLLRNDVTEVTPSGKVKVLIPKNFDLAYAMTIHKSQGSTFDTVAIDLTDIQEGSSSSIIQALLYTGVTRAANNVILLKRDPINYN